MFSKIKFFHKSSDMTSGMIPKRNIFDLIFKNKTFNLFLSVLVLADIFLVSWVVIGVSPKIFQIIAYFDLFVVLILIPDFIYRLHSSENKKKFLIHNCIDLVGMVPLIIVGPQSLFSISRYFRLIGLLRILSLFRNELKRLYDFFHKTHLDSGIIALLLILISGTFVFYFLEKGVNPNIHTFFDALWFVFISISTVGYGDISPVTMDGRIVAAFLIISGVIFFGFLTATISSWIIKQDEKKVEDRKLDRIESIINEMGSEMGSSILDMKSEIESLKEIIEKKNK